MGSMQQPEAQPKRSRGPDAASSTGKKARLSGALPATAATPTAATAAAAAGASPPTPAPACAAAFGRRQQQQQHQQQHQQRPQDVKVFAGVQLAVWDERFTTQAVSRAKQNGAVAGRTVVPGKTTHVIADFSLKAEELHARLERELAATAVAAQPRVNRQLLFRGPPPPPQQQPRRQPLQQQPQQPQQQQQDADRIQFVTVAWLTSSLASGRRLPESDFLIAAKQQQSSPPRSPPAQRQQQQQQQPSLPPPPTEAPLQPGRARGPVAPAAAQPGSAAAPGPAQGQQQQQQQPRRRRRQWPESYEGLILPSSSEYEEEPPPTQQQQQQQQQRQQQGPQEQQQPRPRLGGVAPTPDMICRVPEEPWGTGARWVEPWDEAAAWETIRRLNNHHAGRKASRLLEAERNAVSEAQFKALGGRRRRSRRGSDTDSGSCSEHEGQPPPPPSLPSLSSLRIPSGGSPRVGGAAPGCGHYACGESPVCYVQQFRALKDNYPKGPYQRFQQTAANRAIAALEKLGEPLTEEVAVELNLGDRTTKKLKELVRSGKLQRLEEAKRDEGHQVRRLFTSVWGCGADAADAWIRAGCRTLEEVMQCASDPSPALHARAIRLSEHQMVGLRYYRDFTSRIPRAEASECQALLAEEVNAALERLSGLPRSEVQRLLHVRLMGSFLRGSQDCGDLDLLVSPGPSCGHVPLGELAGELLGTLVSKGWVTEDLPLEGAKLRRRPDEPVSWMGVWKGPPSPCHRRLDVKLYPREQLPFAVNYFGSGEGFSRAIRWWCARPVRELAAAAAAIHPLANAFKLGDQRLVVTSSAIRRGGAFVPVSSAWGKGPARGPGGRACDGRDSGSDDGGAVARRAPPQPDLSGRVIAGSLDAGESHLTGNGSRKETELGLEVACACETDIFRALGLAYVPPHLRGEVQ